MEVAMQCPVCDVALVMADRSGVEIDYCPKCRGIWLDRGELDKIIDRADCAAAPAAPQTATTLPLGATPDPYARGRMDYPHDDHHDHDHGRHGHGRKSFWREIFD
jgi:Zn-finger nucleic acid-binding protein